MGSLRRSAVTAFPATPVVAHLFAVVDGLRLHLLDHGGDGAPVLLLHGALGNAWMWAGTGPRLTGAGRVVAMDLRGYGDSQWSPEHGYTTEHHARDVLAVLDHLRWSSARIVGFSWGGLIGMAAATMRPGAVSALAMIDLPPSSARDERDIPPVAMEVPDHHAAVAAERAAAPRTPPELTSLVAAMAYRPGPHGLVRKHDPFYTTRWPFRAEDWWPALERLVAPLLVIRASESVVFSAEEAQSMVARARQAELVEVGPSGHLVPLEQPDKTAAVLRRFLEDR